MESTGEFWKPVYNLLEANFTVLVVNAQHLKNVPGRKTDLKDAQWIAQLLRCGLLRGSFIPPLPQRDLRDLTRQRTNLIQERADVVNRLHKVPAWANLKLTSVVTDISGISARSMLEALLNGQSDPETLAQLAKGRLRSKRELLVEALAGQLREHHRFLLCNHLVHMDFLEEQIAQFNTQIAALLHAQPVVETIEVETEHTEACGWESAVALLDTIPGVGRATAEVLLAEIGPDMSRFPSAAHLARWARVCPGNHESAGKRLSGSTGQGNNWLRSSLVQAANAAARCTGTYLGD